MAYNPFGKPIGELDESDLAGLVGLVAEGYFVEYKEDFPTNRKIARSIASLANTYGGWYIVGLRTDESHVASEICGFDTARFPDPVAKVRDIVKSRIDPVPVLYLSLIRLTTDRSVLLAYVPPDQNTPFVTDDGKIYRRNHDSSDPVPEDRRHALDRLADQGREIGRRFQRFCSVEMSPRPVGDRDLAWLNLFVMPSPLNLTEKPNLCSREGVDSALALSLQPRSFLPGASSDVRANLPFSHAHATYDSLLLRQSSIGTITRPSVTAELFPSGSMRLHIPVPLLPFSGAWTLVEDPEVDSVFHEMSQADRDQRQDTLLLDFFEAPKLLLQVLLAVAYYEDWLGENHWSPDFRVALTLRGFGDTVPLIDCSSWKEQVQEWGLPVIPRDFAVPEDQLRPLVMRAEILDRDLGFAMTREVLASCGLRENLLGPSLVRIIEQSLESQGSSP
jgi:hypothetical protein